MCKAESCVLDDSDICSVGFVLEDGSGLEDDASDIHVDIPLEDYDPVLRTKSNGQDELSSPQDRIEYTPQVDVTLQELNHELSNEQAWRPTGEQDSHRQGAPTVADFSSPGGLDFSSPASISELTRRHENGGHGHLDWPSFGTTLVAGGGAETSPTGSIPTPDVIPLPKPSRREAFLLHHFVRKIAPWVAYKPSLCSITAN